MSNDKKLFFKTWNATWRARRPIKTPPTTRRFILKKFTKCNNSNLAGIINRSSVSLESKTSDVVRHCSNKCRNPFLPFLSIFIRALVVVVVVAAVTNQWQLDRAYYLLLRKVEECKIKKFQMWEPTLTYLRVYQNAYIVRFENNICYAVL